MIKTSRGFVEENDMVIITTALLALAECLSTVSFTLIIMPARKKGKWNLSVIPLAYVLSFLYLTAVTYNKIPLIMILEYVAIFTPLAIYCAGDFWRNIIIRMIYELATNIVISIRTPLNIYVEEERQYVMTRKTESIGFCVSFIFVMAFGILVVAPILRAIVKRWSPEHKKIYTFIAGFVCLMGLINGLNRVTFLTSENYEKEGTSGTMIMLAYKISMAISVITIFVGNLLYNRWVNGLMKKENTLLKGEIDKKKKTLSAESTLNNYLEDMAHKLEKESVALNCTIIGSFNCSDRLKNLLELIFDCERKKKAENVDLKIIDKSDMVMIMLSDNTEDFNDEIYALLVKSVRELGGIEDFDEGMSLLVPKSEIM